MRAKKTGDGLGWQNWKEIRIFRLTDWDGLKSKWIQEKNSYDRPTEMISADPNLLDQDFGIVAVVVLKVVTESTLEWHCFTYISNGRGWYNFILVFTLSVVKCKHFGGYQATLRAQRSTLLDYIIASCFSCPYDSCFSSIPFLFYCTFSDLLNQAWAQFRKH